MLELLNELAKVWFNWHFDMFWQITVLISLILCIDLMVKKWIWPQLRYILWLLVLLKLLIPPSFSLTTGLYTQLCPWIKTVFTSEYELREANPDDNTNLTIENQKANSSLLSEEKISLSNYTTSPGSVSQSTYSLNVFSVLAPLTWQFYLFFIWLVGTMSLFAGLYFRHKKLCRYYHCDKPARQLPEWFNSLLKQTVTQLKLKQQPLIVLTDKLKCPAVAGLVKPLLLLPQSYLSGSSRQEIKYALMHELTHIKRGDLFIHYLHFIIQIFYWYNPLLWLMRKQVRHLREICCDASIAHYLKEKTFAYRAILLEIARRLLVDARQPGLGFLGLVEDSYRIVTRLQWLEKKTWRFERIRNISIVLVIILFFIFIIPMAEANSNTTNKVSQTILPEHSYVTLNTEKKWNITSEKPTSFHDFIITEKNELMVVDYKNKLLKFFDIDGNYLKSAGDSTYIKDPFHINELNDRILVWDTRRSIDGGSGQFHHFSIDGNYIETISPINDLAYWSFSFLPDGHFFYASDGYRSDSLIHLCDPQGEIIQKFGQLEGEKIEVYNFDVKALMQKREKTEYAKNDILLCCSSDHNVIAVHQALPLIKKYNSNGILIYNKQITIQNQEYLENEYFTINDTLPNYSYMSLRFWQDIQPDQAGGIYLLSNNKSQFIIHHYDKEGNLSEVLTGPAGYFDLFDLKDRMLVAYSRELRSFYRFKI
jgi:beta-lactamase regulating signal transducer with metallopeptidase domain